MLWCNETSISNFLVFCELSIEKVEVIVVATAVLHNIACKNREPLPPLDDHIEAYIREEMATVDFANERTQDIQGNNINKLSRL